MNQLMIHRGPDGEGEFRDAHVALAMRRLSIIDLQTGWQPLYNEDHSLALVCNGEIYNFVELRRQLESQGHRFATHSDCETILHLYEEHGDDCVHHLRGMFAFALWDQRRRRLLLARDRLGEKPLYLAARDEQILFASELRAIVHGAGLKFELDPDAVNLYFHYGYVPDPWTPVVGVRKLPPAHLMTVELQDWRVEERCYWRMEDAPPLEGDPPTLIREQLEEIAELIIRSDVPVGISLSGGLDSSIIACLTASKYPGTMQAISVGYVDRPIQDERDDARALAEHLRMPFHEVELSPADLISALRTMPYERDDPFGDMSGVSYFAVLKRAREIGVPVMLSGHGGDELFWGYRWFREAVSASRRKKALHNGGRVGVRDYLTLTAPPYSYTGGLRWLMGLGGLRTGWQQYLKDRSAPRDQLVFYDTEPNFNAASAMPALYAPSMRRRIRPELPFELFTLPQPWPDVDITMVRLIIQTYMVENGLAQGDRLSMACSVELRLPLVDYRLVETVIGLRKVHDDFNLPPKHWLRQAVQGLVPPFVLARRKRGFSTPWRQWARALKQAFGPQLENGYLVEHEILSPQGAKYLSDRLSPPPLCLPMLMSDRALLLEVWAQQMQSHG